MCKFLSIPKFVRNSVSLKNILNDISWSFNNLIIIGLYVPVFIRVPFFSFRTTKLQQQYYKRVQASRYIYINSLV